MRLSAFFLLVTACTGTIDVGDSGGPAATDVQITVRDGTTPRSGVTVIFEGAGVAAREVVTDARGVAAAELLDGGTVTVIRTYPVPPGEPPIPDEVYSYVGVKRGDRLSLGKPTADDGPAAAVLVAVPELAAGTVKIRASCGAGQGEGPLVAITVRDCPPEIGLYVVDGNGQSFFKRAPFAENIDVSGETPTDALGSTISAQNVPLNTAVNVEQRLGSEGFDFYSTGVKRIDTTPANVDLPQLRGVEHLLLVTSSSNGRTQVVARRTMYTQDILVVDASAGMMTQVTGPRASPTGITWTEEGAGPADVVVASLNVTHSEATGDREYVRMILAPHTGASLQVPVLSGAGASYNPTMDDQVATALGLAQVSGGYDAIRARAFAVGSIVDATPVGGQITLSYSGPAPGL